MRRESHHSAITDRPDPTGPRRSARAFSLVELVSVMALLAVLAATAAPTLSAMADSKRAGLTREVARRLETARGLAMGAARPAGVRIDDSLQRITHLWLPDEAQPPANAPDALGQPTQSVRLESILGGGSVASFVNGDGQKSNPTIWFAADGSPHLRLTNGTLVGPFTTDAVITFAGGGIVTVRRSTGAIEY